MFQVSWDYKEIVNPQSIQIESHREAMHHVWWLKDHSPIKVDWVSVKGEKGEIPTNPVH